jgi:DNA (cytosine-5)-methyltransferase 1
MPKKKYDTQQILELDLFSVQAEFPKEIVNHQDVAHFDDLDLSKDVIICNVKNDNIKHFADGTAQIYYTGKHFPSTVALNKLYYFIPYIGKQCDYDYYGIRDIYLIEIARVGSRKEGEPNNDPNDLRIVFELKFIKHLFDNYQHHTLRIWDTYTDTTLEDLYEMNQKRKHQDIIFNEGKVTFSDDTFTHIDCFAGPGGICTGMHAAGFNSVISIEYVKSCCETYAANHPEVHTIHSDIRKVKKEDLIEYIPKGGVDLVTSGMPCETFSLAGTTSRSFYDDRQFLFREGIRIAKLTNAKMILFENVPGITSKRVSEDNPTLIINMLKEELREAGYSNYIEAKLTATDFGVPQKRQRYFILATRYKSWKLYAPKPNCYKPVTVREALAGLPNVIANSDVAAETYNDEQTDYSLLMRNLDFWRRNEFAETANRLSYQVPMRHKAHSIKRFSLIKPGEGLKDLFERLSPKEIAELQKDGTLPQKIFSKRNIRLELDKPSLTITSHCLDENLHPTENRALTVRECARLQSFPDSYDFCGGPYMVGHDNRSVQDKYEQIGDAVPPLLAYAWGQTILEILTKYRYKR